MEHNPKLDPATLLYVAEQIKNLAFSWPAPNHHTSQLAHLAVCYEAHAHHELAARAEREPAL